MQEQVQQNEKEGFKEEPLEEEQESLNQEVIDEEPKKPPQEQGNDKVRISSKKVFAGIREILIYIAIVAVCVFVIPRYVAQRTIVSGSSMENTLFNADNLLVEKVSYHLVDPKRFDVVVFYPYGRDSEEYFVKRVIGLPGETIQIKGSSIYINGKKLEENYGKDPIRYQGIASDPIKLGDDEFFLMGDNREVSFDSRYEEVGPVHKDLIEGKAVLRIWPFSDFGTFD